MLVYNSLDEFKQNQSIALTIGNFDGVHQGHRHLFTILKTEAAKRNLESTVLTFNTHTTTHLSQSIKYSLQTINEKIDSISNTGLVDNLILENFVNFRDLTAKDFVEEILVNKLKIKLFVIGKNHRFGKNRKGDLKFLTEQGVKYGFEVIPVDLYKENGQVISSSLLRQQREE